MVCTINQSRLGLDEENGKKAKTDHGTTCTTTLFLSLDAAKHSRVDTDSWYGVQYQNQCSEHKGGKVGRRKKEETFMWPGDVALT